MVGWVQSRGSRSSHPAAPQISLPPLQRTHPLHAIKLVRNPSEDAEGNGFSGSRSYPLPMNSTLILSDLILSEQSQFIKRRIMILCVLMQICLELTFTGSEGDRGEGQVQQLPSARRPHRQLSCVFLYRTIVVYHGCFTLRRLWARRTLDL